MGHAYGSRTVIPRGANTGFPFASLATGFDGREALVWRPRLFRALVAAGVLAYDLGVDDELEAERSRVLFCEECGCESEDEPRGWEAHLALEDDGSTTVVIFCPV